MTTTIQTIRPWPKPITPDSVRGKRYYLCDDGVRRVGVTTVEKALGLGQEALIGWAARTEKEATLEAVRRVWEWSDGMSGEGFVAAVQEKIGQAKAHLRKLAEAADVGSEIHAMIQWRLRGEAGLAPGDEPKLSDAATVGYMAWDDWWKTSGLTPIRVEQVVWDETLGYAGTLDLLAQNQAHEIELWDWKSSNYLYPKHHIQVAAYLHAARRWVPVVRASLVRLPKTLDNLEIEVRPLGEIYDPDSKRHIQRSPEKLLEAFEAALTIYRIFLEPDHA